MTDDTPLVPGTIVGLRAWRLCHTGDGWRIRGVFHDYTWPPGEAAVARCLNPAGQPAKDHMAPDKAHECGLYTAVTTERVGLYFGPGYDIVMGTVKVWGHVIEHDMGFRASHAYPASFHVPTCYDQWERVASDLADYNVPIELLEVEHREGVRAVALQALTGLI